MQRVTDGFKARYRRKGLVTSSSTWPPFHAKSFTSLALVHQKVTQLQAKEDTTKIARVRATGDIHKIPELTSSIKLDNICQIFTPVTSGDQAQCPMSILIEGHPGIGKTTLVKEMCLRWANNQLLTSDKLVLLLMLRDPNVQKITSTKQLVRYTQSTDQVQCVLSYLRNNNGVGVTLIIDGFDELSTELRQTSFFRKVIEGDVLYNARVVVTSRPSASACLHQCVQRRIEVLGFEKSSKEEYVDNALKDTPEHLHKLKAHLQQYPNIDALCYIPLNMAIIVYLCLLGSLPPTATKMYESFIINTIYRHLNKVGNIPNNNNVTQIKDFPKPVSKALTQLQKVAFDGLVSDKIVFTVEELPVLCKDDPTCYGLLQSTECYSAEKVTSTQSFNFLHLGIQEFFASKHVTTLSENEVFTLLKESFIVTHHYPDSKSVRLSNMWILYCGITSGQCKILRHHLTTYGEYSALHKLPFSLTIADQRIYNAITISQKVLKDPVMVLYLFQCFQEAQDNELCEVLSKSFDSGVIDFCHHSLLPHLVVSLGFFLSRSHRKWKKLNLEECRIGGHGMSIIHRYLCGDKTSKCEITEINLDYNGLTGASSHLIADIISHLQPHILSLDHNNITNVRDISTAVINTSTVKVLSMGGNGFTAQEALAISDMMNCLGELDISYNKLGDHGAELLSEKIRDIKTLRVLNIECNNIGSSGTIAIANALRGNASLEELYMADISIGRDEAMALNNAIANNKMIKTLSLDRVVNYRDGRTTDKESAMIIMNSLYYNNTITELILPKIKLSKNDVHVITEKAAVVNSIRILSNNQVIDFDLCFIDLEKENYFASYSTEHGIEYY